MKWWHWLAGALLAVAFVMFAITVGLTVPGDAPDPEWTRWLG